MAAKRTKKTGVTPPPVFPKSKTEILADEIYGRLNNCKSTGLYCVVDRSQGTHFFDVLIDGLLAYQFDHYICERLYPLSKCGVIKYPVYQASDEAIAIYNEFIDYSNLEITKEQIADESFVEQRAKRLQEYIDILNTAPPKQSEKDQLAYVSGYNTDLGYPVVALNDIPDEVLKSLSYKLAENAISHFTTINFVNQESFVMSTEVAVADTEYSDILVKLRYGVG
jgi:hypothetical protein